MDTDNQYVDVVWTQRILAEYREMPGLCLTAEQGGRLWGLDPPRCHLILERLVANGHLRRTPQGTYVRMNDNRRHP
jgi:hypothetical protein